MSDKPLVVLDTNVVLDGLVFRDPRVRDLARRIRRQELSWIACPAIRAEFTHMLDHPSLACWKPDRERALAVFDRHVFMRSDPRPRDPPALRCTDPDDQVFLDLALAEGASSLFTRDRALLKLARRALGSGLVIRTP